MTDQLPPDLHFTAEHEWVALDGDVATVGITAYAAEQLGDVVFVALPAVGDSVSAGDVCGEVESHKSVSELFSPVAGEIVAVNDTLGTEPELAGTDPYESGWIFRIRTVDEDVSHLLDAQGYDALLAELS